LSSEHIFISYPHTETEFTARLAADLKNNGVQVWMDVLEGGIRSGDDWRRAIEGGLDNSAAVISVICPDYIISNYCRKELARAERMGLKLFPVFLRPLQRKTDWPIELERVQYTDFVNWREDIVYHARLKALLDILKRDSSEQIGNIPDAETQYLTRLIAELESRKGVLEYVDLAGQMDEPMRPKPRLADEWGLEGSFAILEQSFNSELDPSEKNQISLGNIREAVEQHTRFILIGEPGAGKTTTLRRLALDAARIRLANPKTAPLPILLYLPTWDNEATPENFIESRIEKFGLPNITPSISLYLDGLNEMGAMGTDRAKKLRDWLMSRDATERVIVTCRAEDYTDKLNLGLPVVEVGMMNEGQVRQFARNYLGDDSERFWDQISPQELGTYPRAKRMEKGNDRSLLQLATNPYLLTSLAVVFKSSQDGDLPRNKGALFQKLAMALWERERIRHTAGWIPFDRMEKVYGQLALAMIRENKPIDVSYKYALYYLESDNLLKVGSSATILQLENNSLRFSHQLMQEYFAAAELRHQSFYERLSKPRYQPLRKNYVVRQSTKWDQVVIALCGITDANKVLEQLASVDLYLAAKCIESGIEISEDVGQHITRGLVYYLFSERKVERVAASSAFIETNDMLLSHLTLEDEDIVRLRNNLNDSNFRVRLAAAIILGKLMDLSSVPQLKNLLRDSSRRVRGTVARALGSIGSPEAVPSLIKKLSDTGELMNRNIRVCDLAAEALERIGTPEALEAVRKWREEKGKE
jgi:hypothetical protein